MARIFWTVVALLLLLSTLLSLGVLRGPAAILASQIISIAWSLACPLSLLLLIYAPGLVSELTGNVSHFWQRLQVRQRDVEDLKRKIEHLNKAHHMTLLGNHYLRQGRTSTAVPWFERALAQEPELLDARYKLALCRFDQRDYESAAELLEKIQTEKANHDYGFAQLRLAQSQQRLGNLDRAQEVFTQLLQFYPGQPEGCYHYALLKAELGDYEGAAALMREVIRTVRLAPGFQRRRNRHWLLKAWWWLVRNHRP